MKMLKYAVVLTAWLIVTNESNATVIDFTSQVTDLALNTIGDVTFDQTATHTFLDGTAATGFYLEFNDGNPGNYAFNGYGEDQLGFTFTAPVNLISLDINRAPLCCGGSGAALLNVMLYNDLNTLLGSSRVDSGTGWQTLSFNQQNVARVVFDVEPYLNPFDSHNADHDWFGLDNIVYSENTPTVPEPYTIALMGLGFAAIAASRRKSV